MIQHEVTGGIPSDNVLSVGIQPVFIYCLCSTCFSEGVCDHQSFVNALSYIIFISVAHHLREDLHAVEVQAVRAVIIKNEPVSFRLIERTVRP